MADFGLSRGTMVKTDLAPGAEEEEDYYRSSTGIFPVRKHDATHSIETLLAGCSWAQKASLGLIGVSTDAECDKRMYEKPVEEVQVGQATGSFTFEQISRKFNGKWIGAKRFGIGQKGDYRPIDSYT